ncbi:MAG: carboxymuconolactone decarboxylase family protein [Bacteroidota bacterium]
MAFIDLEEGLPGIIGLLEYRKDTARPIRELTQILLRGESSLTEGEREMIATIVSHRNECTFCTSAHKTTTDRLLGESETTAHVCRDLATAPVSEKMRSLLSIASKVQQSGSAVHKENVEAARTAGATDREIHDTVLIAALFCLYNRYVDGLGTWTPEGAEFYESLADRLTNRGYVRPGEGYDDHKYEE